MRDRQPGRSLDFSKCQVGGVLALFRVQARDGLANRVRLSAEHHATPLRQQGNQEFHLFHLTVVVVGSVDRSP
jgi:hypothetical protein